jgi:hypothetical protein
MSEISITIINIKIIEKAGTLKAIVDFKLNQSEFYSWRIIQQEGQDAWVSPPQESWDGADGKKKYKPLIKFPQELMDKVSSILIGAYQAK